MFKKLVFLLVLFLFFAVPKISNAITQQETWGSFWCIDSNSVKDCELDFVESNPNFQVYGGLINPAQSVGTSVTRYICINGSGIMWDTGSYCWSDGGSSIPLEVFLTNLSDVTNYPHFVLHVRVYRATSETVPTLYRRRVSIDSFSAFPTTVSVGQSFNINWSTDQAYQGVDLMWNGPISEQGGNSPPYYNIGSSGPLTFIANSTGTAWFTLYATGPGTNTTGCPGGGGGGGGGRPGAWKFLPGYEAKAACTTGPPVTVQTDLADPNNPNHPPDISVNIVSNPPLPAGTVGVSSNVATSWTISGPGVTYSDSGTSKNYPNSPSGTYTISNVPNLPGYNPPIITPSSTLNLVSGSSITFYINYTPSGGGPPPPPPPPPPPCTGNCAQYIDQDVSKTMTINQPYSVMVKMKNIGTTTWKSSTGYKLGSQNPQDNTIWNSGRVNVSGNVDPGEDFNFNFTVTAPSTPGLYNFQWRMLREGIEWFGDYTPNVQINVIAPSPTPSPTTSNVTVTEPDYCSSGPAATVGWTYSDPQGSPQSAYRVQIDDQGSFESPEVNSGKVSCSNCRSYFSGSGILAFNTTYKARVRTWNSYDIPSEWKQMSICNGPGCAGDQKSWKTPTYAYPQVNFIWLPASPIKNNPVQFTDQTIFQGNPNGRVWNWLFGEGGTSALQNPTYTYTADNTYQVTLTATDNANQSCSLTKPLSIQKSVPVWKEIAPR